MRDISVTASRSYEPPNRSTYHHRNVPAALRGAARQVLEAGNPEDVGLREISRRIGISATAAYRHFASRDDLMATVAVEGFQELTAALQAAVDGPDPAVAVGLAYLEFALAKRGMFRLMFGPLLALKTKYPALRNAANAAFQVIEGAGLVAHEPKEHRDTAAMAAWGLIHGLSSLFIENVIPAADARQLAVNILSTANFVRAKGDAAETGLARAEARAAP